MLALAAGASLGVGAMAVPVIGTALSTVMTGSVVPTRITDLAGYLTGGTGFGGGKGLGFEDDDSQTSVADDEGQSIGTVGPATSPTVNAPKPTTAGQAVTGKTVASSDQKRALALASFGGGLVIAFVSFVLIRRVVGG